MISIEEYKKFVHYLITTDAGFSYAQYIKQIEFKEVPSAVIYNIMNLVQDSYKNLQKISIDYIIQDQMVSEVVKNCLEVPDISKDMQFIKFWMGQFLCRVLAENIENDYTKVEHNKQLLYLIDQIKVLMHGGSTGVVDYIAEWERRVESSKEVKKVLKYGIQGLDEQLFIEEGTVTGFVAPAKHYKSISLVHAAGMAVVAGMKVLVVNFEGGMPLWMRRLDSRLTGIFYSTIRKGELCESDKERYKRVFDEVKKRGGDVQYMQGYPNRTTCSDIKRELSNLKRRDINIDVVIVDYANLLGSENTRREDWLAQGDVMWGLVDLSLEGRIVLTAFQMNKAKEVGRSIMIEQVASNLIDIEQKIPDDKEVGLIRYKPRVVRDGFVRKQEVSVFSALEHMSPAKETDKYFEQLGW